jgi:hypothetical protein
VINIVVILFTLSLVLWTFFYSSWHWFGQLTFEFGQSFAIWGLSIMLHAFTKLSAEKGFIRQLIFNRLVRNIYLFTVEVFLCFGWNQFIDYLLGNEHIISWNEYALGGMCLFYYVGRFFPKTFIGGICFLTTLFIKHIMNKIFLTIKNLFR